MLSGNFFIEFCEVIDMDVFADLKKYVACEFISDLRYEPHKSRAKAILRELDLSKYSLPSLNDLVVYIYDMNRTFQSVADVQHFFRSHV